MSETRRPIDDDALRETMIDLVFEASRDDLLAALGEEEFASLAARGRSMVQNALRGSGWNDHLD